MTKVHTVYEARSTSAFFSMLEWHLGDLNSEHPDEWYCLDAVIPACGSHRKIGCGNTIIADTNDRDGC